MEILANPLTRSRAALYVRMSTEHQQYSPENQADIIRQYAADHNMEVVQVYSDHGRSGLNIAGREGLNKLMADVESKSVHSTSLLVYDVSRWGRFQDVDESAYYEYVLKRARIATFERTIAEAPASFNANQLRLFLRLFVNVNPATSWKKQPRTPAPARMNNARTVKLSWPHSASSHNKSSPKWAAACAFELRRRLA